MLIQMHNFAVIATRGGARYNYSTLHTDLHKRKRRKICYATQICSNFCHFFCDILDNLALNYYLNETV